MEQKIIDKLKENGWSIFYEHIDQVSEDEYAKIRMKSFGASDSSKLLDISPFPASSHEDLIKEKQTGIIDETISKKASVRMGKDIEHIILRKASEGLDTEVYKPYNMYIDDKGTHLSVNFDGVSEIKNELIPVEAKAVTKYGRTHYNFINAYKQQFNGEFSDIVNDRQAPILDVDMFKNDFKGYVIALAKWYGIPEYYLTQLQQQMLALGSNYGFLVVLDVDNWNLVIFKVYRDDVIIKELRCKGMLYGTKLINS